MVPYEPPQEKFPPLLKGLIKERMAAISFLPTEAITPLAQPGFVLANLSKAGLQSLLIHWLRSSPVFPLQVFKTQFINFPFLNKSLNLQDLPRTASLA